MFLKNERQISHVTVYGYKSIEHAEIDLGMLNVMIGSNGAGKSNFISIFSLLDYIISKKLQLKVSENGGADKHLFFGSKQTAELKVDFKFGNNGYGFVLKPTPEDYFVFDNEYFYWNLSGEKSIGGGHLESRWQSGTGTGIDSYITDIFTDHRWQIYHFNDTSNTAHIKKVQYISDNNSLHHDASNIAPFLYRLRQASPIEYNSIVETIRTVAPFFDDFVLAPSPHNPDYIQLAWKDIRSELIFSASQLSDGTLRFICLAVLLMQPVELMPDTIIMDEPELGLHPFAIQMLAEMMKRAAKDKQVIASTQSVTLLNEFSSDDIIVVDHNERKSEFKRFHDNELKVWLDDEYTLGELWQKNVLGGRPTW